MNRWIRAFFTAALAVLLVSSLQLAKPDYSKKEGKNCAYCHVKAGSKELNDIGKCYEKNGHSLAKCGEKK